MNHLSPEYQFYIQSPEWDVIRRERLAIDDYTCQGCGCQNKPLDVHHLTYERFGHEDIDDLLSLCRRCHQEVHGEPITIWDICQTCGERLRIYIKRILVMGTWWMQYQCHDGHIRSYKDE